ncbi:leucine-rich repeat-containing G-protein coupled receptor 5 isoform X2 [Electrophorus electricus]|uniref:leucine-rich repeat-containing G-protein coupled receptor 5 isoform X2 n=1 Tax=Electrophorus electricus TaxID=8005 RepID=UPI0015D00840|nr:leucine-rich repeat-containing G-protein coupled receptor 5 isoform X2 [Electrophorus electricus]
MTLVRTFLMLLLVMVSGCVSWSQPRARRSDCPHLCHCEEDGTFSRADCADRGLEALPSGMSIFTSYLDLSMNNISQLRSNAFSNLHFLEELRLAGNELRDIPKGAFEGLINLKVLMLQNNQLQEVPGEAFQSLRSLHSLRLDANHISRVPPNCFDGLSSLRHLWLDDNALTEVPADALRVLSSLQAMTLALNKITHIPDRAFANLSSLVVLHVSNNRVLSVGKHSFDGLRSLETLTCADVPRPLRLHVFVAVPSEGERERGSRTWLCFWISADPDLCRAFLQGNTTQAAVITQQLYQCVYHFCQHTPQIRATLYTKHNGGPLKKCACVLKNGGKVCLHKTKCCPYRDLNYNRLEEFPVAIRSLRTLKELGFHHNNIKSIPGNAFVGNPSLVTIFFYDNPIHFVGRSAFQHLPELRTLSLNGATDITEFPDLKGTHSLERLAITGARITSLPSTLCAQLPNLQTLDLSHNLIQTLPSLQGCEKIRMIDLHHNQIQEVRGDTFGSLPSLQTLHLGWNELSFVGPLIFSGLAALTKLDLSSNKLSSLPVVELHTLTHLKLAGNVDLQELLPVENFPTLRVVEMPYAFQCCAFLNWEKYGSPSRRSRNGSNDQGLKEGLIPSPDHDLENVSVDSDDDPLPHHSVQCSPTPGPFQPCFRLFGSWLIRGGVWTIAVLSLVCNALVMLSVFLSPMFLSSVKLLMGLLALVNSVLGLCSVSMALLDALTFGSFASYGTRWQSSVSCKLTGFLSVFASETGVFLLMAATVERSFSIRSGQAEAERRASTRAVKMAVVACFVAGLVMSVAPLLQATQQSTSSLCLPLGEPSALGFPVAQVLVNSLCYLVMTVIYTRLYCSLEKADVDKQWGCAMVRHVAWLIFADCVLYFPVAFLSFSALLRLSAVGPGVATLVLLVVAPLPACINPLLYVLFNPHFKEDLGLVLRQTRRMPVRNRNRSRVSLNSEDAEKQSCDSTQALVPFASSDESGSKSLVLLTDCTKSSHLAVHCACTS